MAKTIRDVLDTEFDAAAVLVREEVYRDDVIAPDATSELYGLLHNGTVALEPQEIARQNDAPTLAAAQVMALCLIADRLADLRELLRVGVTTQATRD